MNILTRINHKCILFSLSSEVKREVDLQRKTEAMAHQNLSHAEAIIKLLLKDTSKWKNIPNASPKAKSLSISFTDLTHMKHSDVKAGMTYFTLHLTCKGHFFGSKVTFLTDGNISLHRSRIVLFNYEEGKPLTEVNNKALLDFFKCYTSPNHFIIDFENNYWS